MFVDSIFVIKRSAIYCISDALLLKLAFEIRAPLFKASIEKGEFKMMRASTSIYKHWSEIVHLPATVNKARARIRARFYPIV